MKFKALVSLVLCVLLLLGGLCSCSDTESTSDSRPTSESDTLSEENTEMETEKMTDKKNENNKKPTQDSESDKEIVAVGDVFAATVYNVAAVKTADETVAGSFKDWKG